MSTAEQNTATTPGDIRPIGKYVYWIHSGKVSISPYWVARLTLFDAVTMNKMADVYFNDTGRPIANSRLEANGIIHMEFPIELLSAIIDILKIPNAAYLAYADDGVNARIEFQP